MFFVILKSGLWGWVAIDSFGQHDPQSLRRNRNQILNLFGLTSFDNLHKFKMNKVEFLNMKKTSASVN